MRVRLFLGALLKVIMGPRWREAFSCRSKLNHVCEELFLQMLFYLLTKKRICGVWLKVQGKK